MYCKSINNLISAFRKLPTVGQKTAERFVFHLLKKGKKDVSDISIALQELVKNVKSCEQCFDFSDNSPCPICSDNNRDRSLLCIVAEPPDIQSIEKTGAYKGLYFVLRSLINVDQANLNQTKIVELIKRIKNDTTINEVILALNPNMQGETTSLYLQNQLVKTRPNIKTSRLARGLPMESDLQYADEITLSAALKNRS